jgi:DNA-binding LytR/AlgR family response regulator
MREMRQYNIVAIHEKEFLALLPEITAFLQNETTSNGFSSTVVIGMFKLPINPRDILMMIEKMPKQGGTLDIPIVKGCKTESISDIVYFENKNRRVNIITTLESYPTTLSMKTARELTAAHPFSSPYVSYLVNLQWVEQIAGRDVVMKNRDIIPLSQKRAARFRQDYRDYMSTLQ